MRFLTRQELVSKSFRKKLLDNPNAVLDIDESIEVIVKENSKNKTYLAVSNPINTNPLNLSSINAAAGDNATRASSLGSFTTLGTVGSATSTAGSLSSVGSVSSMA